MYRNRIKKITHLIIFLLSLLIIGCSESSTEPDQDQNYSYSEDLKKLFPVNIGSEYNYQIDTLDKVKNEFIFIGNRKVKFESSLENEGSENFFCEDKYFYNDTTIFSNSSFRITNTTIEFVIDTNGLGNLVADSIKFAVNIDMNETATLISYPYKNEEEWIVTKAQALFGGNKLTIFSITANYSNNELLDIPGFENKIETEKFNYKGVLNIPNITNPFLSTIKEYSASIWISPEYGIVKIEGFSLFINPIFGQGIRLSDSSKVTRHTLQPFVK